MSNQIDFVGIGPARAATTWLYECLKAHPQIIMPRWDKKTHFFDLYYERGLGWYENQYSPPDPGQVRGEITETYIFYPEVAARIRRHYPEAKIFACLRDPVERSFSAYLHLRRDGEITVPFEEALGKYGKALVDDNFYYDELVAYFDLFPPEQLMMSVFEEDLKPDPRAFLNRLYGFLGVDDQFLPDRWDQVVNQSVNPRFPLLNKAMLLAHFALRKLDVYKYLTPLKELKAVQKLRFKDGGPDPAEFPAQTRARLRETFAPQVDKLSRLLGRDLSCWR